MAWTAIEPCSSEDCCLSLDGIVKEGETTLIIEIVKVAGVLVTGKIR